MIFPSRPSLVSPTLPSHCPPCPCTPAVVCPRPCLVLASIALHLPRLPCLVHHICYARSSTAMPSFRPPFLLLLLPNASRFLALFYAHCFSIFLRYALFEKPLKIAETERIFPAFSRISSSHFLKSILMFGAAIMTQGVPIARSKHSESITIKFS